VLQQLQKNFPSSSICLKQQSQPFAKLHMKSAELLQMAGTASL
jgi:hypothetical protein